MIFLKTCFGAKDCYQSNLVTHISLSLLPFFLFFLFSFPLSLPYSSCRKGDSNGVRYWDWNQEESRERLFFPPKITSFIFVSFSSVSKISFSFYSLIFHFLFTYLSLSVRISFTFHYFLTMHINSLTCSLQLFFLLFSLSNFFPLFFETLSSPKSQDFCIHCITRIHSHILSPVWEKFERKGKKVRVWIVYLICRIVSLHSLIALPEIIQRLTTWMVSYAKGVHTYSD